MPTYLLSVFAPAESNECGPYPSKEVMLEALAAAGTVNGRLPGEGHLVFAGACRGKLEVRSFRTERPVAALLDP
ncbi:MAG: hypothetical protein EA340_09970 [Nitriliruptor sp.]|nr:MAG: hypothetical protein EA340_09970 [Nitriliruptor sp.]